MNWQIYITVSIILSTLFITVQRADPTKRGAIRNFMLFCLGLLGLYVALYETYREGVMGFITGLIISGLFWAVIGRYNPAGSSDDIHVIGMDD
jgi:hypothetical protein